MDFEDILTTVATVALVIVSASIHEFGHALAAYKLGDDTAKRAGRLTINPLAHIDPFGSVVLPLVMALANGPVFAFAKPVPYNPNKLRNPRRDDVIVAFAGPLTNIIQACVGALVARLVWKVGMRDVLSGEWLFWAYTLAATYAYVNCILAFFNLIPLPPLDGSSILMPLLKGEALRRYYVIQRYSLPILMVCLYLLPALIGFDPLDIYLDATAGRLFELLLGW